MASAFFAVTSHALVAAVASAVTFAFAHQAQIVALANAVPAIVAAVKQAKPAEPATPAGK